MRVFNRSTLVTFWKEHPDAEKPLRLWFSIASKARWVGPADVRRVFGTADFLAANRVVFDIKGNPYRWVAQIKYAPLCIVFIRFVGTHAEYDRIDAGKVRDLEQLIGSRARVSEVLSGRRPLTLAMIRRLHEALDIPADILIAEVSPSVNKRPLARAGKRASSTRNAAEQGIAAGGHVNRAVRSRKARG